MRIPSLLSLTLALALVAPACFEETKVPSKAGALNEKAAQWLERARESFRSGDLEDARESIQSAASNAPDSADIKIAAARIHLARLEFDEVNRLLNGLQTVDALALRGRARWYAGDLEGAADDLEALLTDPQVKDDWAKTIARLARQGVGRKPFSISGGLLAPVQIQRIRSAHMVVPVEINGESGLALVATGRAEVVLDSSTRKDPSWVQMRFGERVEVRDVPALVEDLSGISKDVGAPIKALLGVNLLRRLNVTFDFQGEQFVVRTREPPPPPKATRVGIAYAQGGAMVARALLRSGDNKQVPLLINTLLPYPIALDEHGLKLGGVDVASLQPVPNDARTRGGKLPYLRLGAFDLPEVPVVAGPLMTDLQNVSGMEISGTLGAGLLALFRCSMTDGGRVLWIEDNDEILQMFQQQPQGPAPAGSGAPVAPVAPGSAPPPAPPAPAPAASGSAAPRAPKAP